mgnify:CR=1 FL=1
MEDKLVTLAILTYAKAQILKNVLENEGIETYIHNVNQIQPVVSSGVRVRIKESDLPHALKITESSAWLSEEVVGGKAPKIEKGSNKVVIPVDFSNYSLKACEFGFNFAKNIDAEVVLLHVYFTPIYATSLPYGDVFNYQLSDEENVRSILQKVHADLNVLSPTPHLNCVTPKWINCSKPRKAGLASVCMLMVNIHGRRHIIWQKIFG